MPFPMNHFLKYLAQEKKFDISYLLWVGNSNSFFPFSFHSFFFFSFKKLDVRIHLDKGQGVLRQVSATENICI